MTLYLESGPADFLFCSWLMELREAKLLEEHLCSWYGLFVDETNSIDLDGLLGLLQGHLQVLCIDQQA